MSHDDELATLLAPLPGDRGANGGGDGEYMPLLTDSHGTVSRLVTEQAAPQRGSTPPPRAAYWPEDDALMLRGGLEACLSVMENVVGPRFNEEQQRALGVLWRELVERMEAAGITEEIYI